MVKEIGELSVTAPPHPPDPIRLARMVKQIGQLSPVARAARSPDPIRLVRMVKEIGELRRLAPLTDCPQPPTPSALFSIPHRLSLARRVSSSLSPCSVSFFCEAKYA
jgi:hypothetical protein